MSGFLDDVEVKVSVPLLPSCQQCGLFRGCKSPYMKPFGNFERKILFVGESPGQDEDEQGRPFVGKTGKLLREVLAKFDVDLDRDCLTTNSLVCRPEGNEIKNPKSIAYCRPNLAKTVRDFRPEIVILLGAVAVKGLITGWLWPDSGGSFDKHVSEKNLRGKWCGWQIPCQAINAWVCPTWHPSFVARSERENNGQLIRLFWEKDLEAALALKGRPWKQVPDYGSRVEVVLDDREAARGVEAIAASGKPVAFDLETGALKPQASFVHSCSVSDGKRSLAFPWAGRAIDAMKAFLTSGVPKIGANAKFEHVWIMDKLGIEVRNWLWDCVNDAHLIDNRSGTTGVDFQAWVLLGQAQWDGYARKFLKGKHGWGNEANKIKQADLRKILLYNGLDSILEYHVAMKQMGLLGIEKSC